MREQFLSELVEVISGWPEVVAIAEGGSHARGNQDQSSDLDLYIYVHSEVPFVKRSMFIDPRSDDAELDNRIWETGDEWTDRSTGMVVDMMYRSPDWIEGELVVNCINQRNIVLALRDRRRPFSIRTEQLFRYRP
jgi:predicted nucleotidyltransferase